LVKELGNRNALQTEREEGKREGLIAGPLLTLKKGGKRHGVHRQSISLLLERRIVGSRDSGMKAVSETWERRKKRRRKNIRFAKKRWGNPAGKPGKCYSSHRYRRHEQVAFKSDNSFFEGTPDIGWGTSFRSGAGPLADIQGKKGGGDQYDDDEKNYVVLSSVFKC